MKLNVEELKQFNAKSSQIPTSTLLPILSYLKFEPGKVTKNSLNSFICMDISCTDTMLVDEKQLMAFVNYTKATEIDLKIKDGQVLITDGTKINYTSPTEPVQNFPVNDSPEDVEWLPLKQGLINDLDIAANFSIEDGETFRSHVFIGNGLIGACDNFIGYLRKVEMPVDIVLLRQVALIIGKLEVVEFNQNDSYHFFTSGKFKYGFIKSTIPMVNFTPFISDLTGQESFVISKKQLISINDLAINRSPLPQVIGNFSCSKDLLNINFTDSNYELSLKESLPCIGSIEGEFTYNAAIFNRMLKSIPDDLLRFTFFKNKLYVTSDTNSFISLIMLIKN